jgi:hypothetical protein
MGFKPGHAKLGGRRKGTSFAPPPFSARRHKIPRNHELATNRQGRPRDQRILVD